MQRNSPRWHPVTHVATQVNTLMVLHSSLGRTWGIYRAAQQHLRGKSVSQSIMQQICTWKHDGRGKGITLSVDDIHDEASTK